MKKKILTLAALLCACVCMVVPSMNLQAAEKIEVATGTTKLSADNSLQVLSLSAGTLSPEFTGKTVKYTATVPNDVASVTVTATPVHENAVVESITGADNLQVGSNEIKVVVKAENGVTATYTITVTRQEVTAAATEPANGTTTDGATDGTAQITENGDAGTTEVGSTDTPTTDGTVADGTNAEGASTETASEDAGESDASNMEYLQEQYNDLSDQYAKEKKFARNTIGVLVFVIAVLLIVIINLILHRNDRDEDIFPEDDMPGSAPKKQPVFKEKEFDEEPLDEKPPREKPFRGKTHMEDDLEEEDFEEDDYGEEDFAAEEKPEKGKKSGFLWKHKSDDLEEDEFDDEELEEDDKPYKEEADEDLEVLDLNDL